MRPALVAPLLAALAACTTPPSADDDTDGPADTDASDDTERPDTDDPTDTPDDTDVVDPDADRDGVPASADCDDADRSSTTRATDADCDGFVTAIDCDDADPTSTFRALDDDCDGAVAADDCDDEDPASPIRAEDADCDGAATADDCDDLDPRSTVVADDADCDASVTADDCDDADPDAYPGATDVPYDGVDADCAGDSDYDGDADGADDASFGGEDCDDADPLVGPDAAERCNGKDDDCDGTPDSPLPDDAPTVYLDADGDGFGGPIASGRACAPPSGSAAADDDCDDGDDTTFPGAPNIACDGQDNDCDPDTLPVVDGAIVDGTPYTLLADALADAAEGSTVTVCEGRHLVTDLVVARGLTLVGPAGAGATVLDAGGSGAVLRVTATEPVTLRGLTLTRGAGLSGATDPAGGGLHAVAGARVTLEAVEVVANRAGLGGGIYAGPGATVVLDSSLVSGNRAPVGLSASAAGGGVFLDDGAVLDLFESRVEDNTARTCGGVHVGAEGRVEGDGASFVAGNVSDLAGGGLCATRGGAEISGIAVLRNVADGAGGGLQLTDASVTDVVVRGNQTRLDGGGLVGSGTLLLTRVDLVNNRANMDAGGIDLPLAAASLTLDSCVVAGNTALFPGADAGGVRVNGGRLVSIGTDWGTGASANSPTDVSFTADAVACDLVGLASFDVQDGGGAAACP